MPEASPLAGKRVIVTRPRAQLGALVRALEAMEAIPVQFPVMRIEPIEDVPGLDEALRSVGAYDWVVFTSANGVEVVWDRLARLGQASESMRSRKVAAIGPATAEALRQRGVETAYVPESYVGDDLASGLPKVQGMRVLLTRAAESRPALPELLAKRGAQVDEFPVYRAVAESPGAEALAELRRGAAVLTFTSPSTVRFFVAALDGTGLDPRRLPADPVIACIGPVTAEAARRAGLAPRVVAQVYTTAGLVEALAAYFNGRDA